MRLFQGEFDFEQLPAPLETVKVNFTLEIARDIVIPEGDWEIKLGWDRKAMRLLGDSVFVWSGSHSLGSTYSGSFELVPLLSGFNGFQLYMPGEEEDGALDVKWCFDKDGSLTFLGKEEIGDQFKNQCTLHQCTFFNEDSVHMIQRDMESYPDPKQLFITTMTVCPPFNIGDTSTVRYHLVAGDDLNVPLEIELTGRGMQVVSNPERLPTTVSRADIIDYEIKVVPLAVRGIHHLRLNLRRPGHLSSSKERYFNCIDCFAVFRNDGSLRFISDVGLGGLDETFLPDAFPPLKVGDNQRIKLSPDSEEVLRYKF